ncbi:LuxR C-terminal-related transcriptional regulator [Streptomyces sp. NPDC001985]|uniref:LuxR C-terminal-related transcriptional regulator n=1 Tax=Streptomyces sp. NPDC001985 TaxID=3154406 RepID=UPI00331D7769
MAELLLERNGLLDTAARSAASARSGHGRWLLLRGEAGSGRTALLEEIVRREAADGRMRTLRVRASPEESGFAFSVVRQLFPRSGPLPFDEPAPAEEQRIFHRLTDALADTASRRPVLLAVEDLDLADEPSRRWLGYLTRRLSDVPALLLLTSWGEGAGAQPDDPPDGRAGLCDATGAEVPVPALGPGAVTELLAAHGVRGEAARLCAGATAGNPMLLRALLADLPDGRPPRGLADLSGTRYRRAMARWLHSPTALFRRPLALAVALAGGSPAALDPALLGEVAGLAPSESADPRRVEPLIRMLAHPPAREAVLAAADPAELDRYRYRLAQSLYELGASADEIAEHLLRLRQTGEEWMTRTLEEAAESALSAGRPERAARLLRHAMTGPVPPARHIAITLRLGALEMLRSSEAGTRRLRESLSRADCHDPYAVASALSGSLLAQGRTATAIRVMEEAGNRISDQQLSTAVRISVAGMSTHDAQGWHRAAAEMHELMGTAPDSVEPLACALATVHEAGTGRLDAGTAVARVTSRLSAPVDTRLRTGWVASAASLLEWADRLDEARALVERELPGQPDLTHMGHQYLLTTRATVDLRAGRFRRVIEENTPLLESARGGGVQLPYLHAMVAVAWHELGYRERAWEQLAALGAEGARTTWGWDEVRCARGRMYTAEGRWEEALESYLDCGARMTVRGFVNPVSQPWRAGAATVLVRLGRTAEAVELAEENLRHARAWGTPRVVGVALRAQAVAVGGGRGLKTLTEAVELLRTAPAPVELIEALNDLGRAQAAVGQTRKGRTTLSEAMHLAQRLVPAAATAPPLAAPRMSRLVESIGRALRAARTRKPHAAQDCCKELTQAERRIVDLAVQGLTNAQICVTLQLARRTVETHLTNAYKKLGVERRTQLAARLAAPPS